VANILALPSTHDLMRGMTKLALTDSELEDIAEALDSPEVMEKLKVKLLVLRMHHEGIEHGVIARSVSKHPNTITSYLQEYADGGLSASLEDRAYKPSSALLPFMQCLRCSFTVAAPSTAKYAVKRIAALTGMTLSEEQARRLMRRLGMRYRKTASIPGKSDPQMQFDFLRKQMEPRLIEAAHGQRKVFFVDAAHFVLGCFLGMIWSFGRLFIKGASGRQRYNVLGAVDSHSKEVITVRTIDNINALTLCQLLEVLASKHSTLPLTIILDNARYQRCECVQTRAAELGIELLFLPTYSPNLNLIERLWKLTKTKCLRNKYYPEFALFTAAIDSFLDSINSSYQKELESLLTLNFQLFTNPDS
jgi:transposase